MIKTAYVFLLTGFLITSMASGYLWFNQAPQLEKEPVRRLDFTLPDLQGNLHSSSEWDGKVVVVNFWATWCPPCIREIPFFIDLQTQYGEQGLQFIGIAIDNLPAIQHFVANQTINYPILIGEQEGITIAQNMGNSLGALPYTVVIDRTGNMVWRHPGEVTQRDADYIILPLLKKNYETKPDRF